MVASRRRGRLLDQSVALLEWIAQMRPGRGGPGGLCTACAMTPTSAFTGRGARSEKTQPALGTARLGPQIATIKKSR